MNICLIQARLTSSRLPGKCLMKINNHYITSYVIEAAKKCSFIDYVGVICPEEDYQEFNKIYGKSIFVFGGDKENVLKRYCDAIIEIEKQLKIKKSNLKINNIIRLTSDCPLLLYFHGIINETIKLHNRYNFQYSNNLNYNGFPSGLDVEVIRKDTLFDLYNKVSEIEDNKKYYEHVTIFLRENIELYNTGHLTAPSGLNKDFKFSIDTKEDFERIEFIINLLNLERDFKSMFTFMEV